MKTRFFLNVGLFTLLLASCAPAAVTLGPALSETATVSQESSTTSVADSTTVPLNVATATPIPLVDVPTEEIAPTPFPVATSRGPNLEATDPQTVSMASGGLQFVEFFEFW